MIQVNIERVQEIHISEISDFPDYPFNVRQDEAMLNMTESIKANGVRQPAIIRPLPDGGYEMLSGHRRKAACLAIGLTTIPAVVREMTDDEAISSLYKKPLCCLVVLRHMKDISPNNRT